MKVFVIGANGQIGKQLTTLLHESKEHAIKAMVRTTEQASSLEEKGIETALISLEESVQKLAEAIEGCDALVFAAGSGGSTGADKTLLIDLDGAVKAIEAAEKANVSRFIMVSAIQAHNRDNWSDVIRPYYVAKHYADRLLEHSSLNYTIIRPGGLTNEAGTGKIHAAENITSGNRMIPREDVAKTIMASLEAEKVYRKAFDLVSGEHSIQEVLQNII
ncbi:SDR family oxidoreductase [Bacillus sp. B1-b2]|uniref:SDR family oxidoreductase n=1 Tax=Bacillus sp. B1-b2 TaxID=2653201 RepID=UPI0012619923|nr:SDR family oxidoreductase [Bacillus sp. B1-b2]KAB7668872.1 SDR family oxidoreductase [Bacillus sp. B1-b2]